MQNFGRAIALKNFLARIENGEHITQEEADVAIRQIIIFYGAANEVMILNSENVELIEIYTKLKEKIMDAVSKPSDSNVVDIVYCRTPEMAKDLFEFLIKKGYSVAQSTVQINTGTHGSHVVKRLDVLKRESNITLEEQN